MPTCFACGSHAEYVGFSQVDGCTNQKCRFYSPKKFDFWQALERASSDRFLGFYSEEPMCGDSVGECLVSVQIPLSDIRINTHSLTCTIEGKHSASVDPKNIGKRLSWVALHDGNIVLFKWPLHHQYFHLTLHGGDVEIVGPVLLLF